MKRHKWGIWWLVLLAWNAANFGKDAITGHWWFALLAFVTAALCAVMAYRDLTTSRVGSVTITITPDTRAFDAATKRAQRRKP